MKVIHLKSQESVALPIYNSKLSHLYEPEKQKKKQTKSPKKEVRPGMLRNISVGWFNEQRDQCKGVIGLYQWRDGATPLACSEKVDVYVLY